MITRGIVEEVIDKFKYRVRIPIFDRVEQSSHHTSFSDLSVATACVPKGVGDSIKVGDVVFIAFEHNSYSEPLILGHLYREALGSTVDGLMLKSDVLTVLDRAILPVNTKIGEVTSDKFTYLMNVTGDIQEQLDQLKALVESKL